MKILFDTSVLVPALVNAHPHHGRALPWFEKAKNAKFDWLVSQHSLAETYNTLTTLAVQPRIPPDMARRMIRENIEAFARLVPLTPADYAAVMDRMADNGLSGPLIFDALIAHAAQKSGADQLLTLDPHDFRRVWPDGADKIREP